MLTIGEKLHGVTFKKRAPRAIKEIKAFAEKAMVRQHSPLRIIPVYVFLSMSISDPRKPSTERIIPELETNA